MSSSAPSACLRAWEHAALRWQLVGPGWDLVLVPEQVARQAVRDLDAMSLDPVGAVFALEGRWGFFLPPWSDDPPWPAGITYLRDSSEIYLPPPHWVRGLDGSGCGWVRRRADRHLLTAPLLLQPLVAALSCAPPPAAQSADTGRARPPPSPRRQSAATACGGTARPTGAPAPPRLPTPLAPPRRSKDSRAQTGRPRPDR